MATYSLSQRGRIEADATDGATPVDFTLPSAIKPASSFVVATIKESRKPVRVQRDVENFDNTTVFPVTVNLGTQVDPECSVVIPNHVEQQAAPNRGVLVELINNGADLRFTSPALAAGETLDVAWQVIEYQKPRGATVRILDANTVRLEWDGTLTGNDTIDADFELFDIENLGDDIKEILFRNQIILGYLGENMITDLYKYDQAGNPITFRLRVFNSKANREAATIDLPAGDPLQTGELARVDVVQDFATDTNDRKSITMDLTNKATNPDIN